MLSLGQIPEASPHICVGFDNPVEGHQCQVDHECIRVRGVDRVSWFLGELLSEARLPDRGLSFHLNYRPILRASWAVVVKLSSKQEQNK